MNEILPHVSADMLSADYWVKDDMYATDESAKRSAFQHHIYQHTNSMTRVLDVWSHAKHATPDLPLPTRPTPPESPLYNHHGEPLGASFFADLAEDVISAKPILPRLQPGFAVRRTDVRRFPTQTPAFRTANDREFDRFQDAALHTFEPVLIGLETLDKKFLYIVSTTYSGWVRTRDIARATPDQFIQWSNVTNDIGRRFVIPLANNVYSQAAPYDANVSKVNLEFAAYIPLCEEEDALGNQSVAGNIGVYLPVRNSDGWLEVHRAHVNKAHPVHIGFCRYSRQSVVRAAFCLLGERYGWGDSFGNHDCSSLIMDSYRTLGLQLPRDADKQEAALPNLFPIPATASFDERTEMLKTLRAGDVLYMPGHTMMYLSYQNGHHYVIHDFAGYTEDIEHITDHSARSSTDSGGESKNVPINEVMVSTLDIRTSRQQTYLEELTSAAKLFTGQ